MGDVSIRKRVFQKTLKSQNDTRISKRLALLYLIISFLSVPARSGKRQPEGQVLRNYQENEGIFKIRRVGKQISAEE